MRDVDEARRKAEQFATYWYGERATVTRLEQHDPIVLTPLAVLDAPVGDAPVGDDTEMDAYAWTAIVHPPQASQCASPSCVRPQAGMASRWDR